MERIHPDFFFPPVLLSRYGVGKNERLDDEDCRFDLQASFLYLDI